MIENPDPDDYFVTIAKESFLENKVKGSKFLGFAFPITDKQQAEELLDKHRKIYYDATHNCFAYSLGNDDEIFRFSDDGEPNGTAGRPIYQAIKHFDLKNVLVIVTRYFGGTKLGVGPLARAYYDVAFDCLNNAERKIEYLTETIRFNIDYSFVSSIKRILEPISVDTKEEYLETVTFTSKILKSKIVKLRKDLIELTQGKVDLSIYEKPTGRFSQY